MNEVEIKCKFSIEPTIIWFVSECAVNKGKLLYTQLWQRDITKNKQKKKKKKKKQAKDKKTKKQKKNKKQQNKKNKKTKQNKTKKKKTQKTTKTKNKFVLRIYMYDLRMSSTVCTWAVWSRPAE